VRGPVRWIAVGGGVLALIVLVGAGGVYAVSAVKLASRLEVPAPEPRFREEWADADRGARLTRVYGCVGCHGEGLGGRIFVDQPMFGRVIAPNLTRLRETYSDADFVRLLRHGVRPDGTGVIPAMPAQAFTHLADEDLAAILAHVRALPAIPDSLPSTRLALPLRAMLLAGVIDMVPDLIDHGAPPRAAVDRDDPVAFGSYLAHSTCTECHGPDLRGQDMAFMVTPHLGIAATYTPDDFRAFLRTGIALGGRELPTMSGVARARFAAYTDNEIDALHAFLTTLASGG